MEGALLRLTYLIIILSIAARYIKQQYQYLWNGPRMIQAAYDGAKGATFSINTPGNMHHMISDICSIRELYSAKTSVLSLHALAKEWLQPQHTMEGFEWHERRGVDKLGFVRVLQTILPSHLPRMLPLLEATIVNHLPSLIPTQEDPIALYPLLKRTVAHANCLMFFGSTLGQDPDFIETASSFAEEVVLVAEVIRLAPYMLRRPIGSLMSVFLTSRRKMMTILEPEVRKRLSTRYGEIREAYASKGKPFDCMQWLIDACPCEPQWTCERMLGEIVAVWFGSVHQLSMTAFFAITDLMDHPAYYHPLLEESMRSQSNEPSNQYVERPLLDSFLRESARYSYGDAVSTRRKALQNFRFSDGTIVHTGDWVCVPQGAIMMDDKFFVDPHHFDGFRFVKESHWSSKAPSTKVRHVATQNHDLTSLHDHALLWGAGSTACPGRFYASALLRLIFTKFLMTYNCPKPAIKGPRSYSWRSTIIPRSDFTIWLTKRSHMGRS